MTEVEVLMYDQNYRSPSPERFITVEKIRGKEGNNSFSLRTREERTSLLKAGFTGKDIESEYLILNGIVVIDVHWQDLKSK